MATFKCRATGNTVDFDLEWDIKAMRQHPDYEEIVQEVKEEKKPVKKVKVEEQE
jgi:predicted nucleotidyltransferase